MVMSTLLFFFNALLFNFTLGCNRIWGMNQLFAIDLLRLMCILANGNRILIVMVMVVYLMVSIGVGFFRPVYLLSAQNKYAQMIAAISV